MAKRGGKSTRKNSNFLHNIAKESDSRPLRLTDEEVLRLKAERLNEIARKNRDRIKIIKKPKEITSETDGQDNVESNALNLEIKEGTGKRF